MKSLVEQHIRDGRPVASAALAGRDCPNLCPASIRFIMADLERKGLLDQPHPSAGRVPTAEGYRYYVDNLMPSGFLNVHEKEMISRSFVDADVEFATLQERASNVLSRLSRCVGLVLTPPFRDMTLQHIEFIGLNRSQLLVVIVTRSMVVRNRVIRVDTTYGQNELEQFSAELRERFAGLTLRGMYERLLQELREDRDRYHARFRRVLQAMVSVLDENRETSAEDAAGEGEGELFMASEDADLNSLAGMHGALEQKHRLVRLLAEIVGQEGVQVRIGTDIAPGCGAEFSLVAARYGCGPHGVGSLGIVGPARIEYSRCVAMVDQVAIHLSRVLARNVSLSEGWSNPENT